MKLFNYLKKNKSPLKKENIVINADIPKWVTIPMQQHIGKAASCIVKVGDKVSEGDLIGKANGIMSANVHSSIQGLVRKIYKSKTLMKTESETVLIEFEGKFNGVVGNSFITNNWINLKSDDLINYIYAAGLVDVNDTAIPLHNKLKKATSNSVNQVIINGLPTENDPGIFDHLIIKNTEQIIEGIRILKKILNLKSVIIALLHENKKKNKFISNLFKKENIRIHIMQYSNFNMEKLLIKQITHKEIPSNKFSYDIGVLVCHINSIYNIYKSIILNKPLTRKIINIKGENIKKTGNYNVRIGTSIIHLLKECGLIKNPKEVIFGNLMRRFPQNNLELPITKEINSLTVLSNKKEKI